jgi:hypothetical protein
MLRGNRQELPVYRTGRIIVGAELLQPFSHAPTPCGIFAVTIYEATTTVMPCHCTARCSIHFQASMNAEDYGNP